MTPKPARLVLHILPLPKRKPGWMVKQQQPAAIILIRARHKADIIAWAKGYAKVRKPSQIIVHRRDGAIQREWTYGDDPYPPKG